MSDTLKSTLTKLKLGPDDLLLVQVHPEDDTIGVGERLRRLLTKNGITNPMIVCREDTKVERIDPETMARHGWYRKAAPKKD
ncbi:MAG: hypothetical protein AAGI37_15490 [Planctomycetota bacterium]